MRKIIFLIFYSPPNVISNVLIYMMSILIEIKKLTLQPKRENCTLYNAQYNTSNIRRTIRTFTNQFVFFLLMCVCESLF